MLENAILRLHLKITAGKDTLNCGMQQEYAGKMLENAILRLHLFN
jgi:hypothetical protein